jgi:5-methylcytosine-specific restriction protein A
VAGFGAKANITVTIDFEDLKAATADATGRLVYGDGLSAAAVRRLACDAKIIPLVLGSNSEPLDVGRAERLVTRAMRRALNARDRGCVVCGAPPVQCDAHHLTSWIDGGITAVSNLVLLCRRHHVDLHAGKWTVTIDDGIVQVSRPTWADPPPLPRRRSTASPPRAPVGVQAAGADDERTRTSAQRPRSKRWSADSATMQEAARFAVWGETPASDPPAIAAPTSDAPTAGASTSGAPTSGEPTGAASTSGASTSGASTSGASTSGEPTTGAPTSGASTSGEPASGASASGASASAAPPSGSGPTPTQHRTPVDPWGDVALV